ncbi:MAG: hypothetical protein CMM49_03750 [Rhodospirillaceae bacterium]|nr:hypothetical protein [Rhodospirillaceae bacterium]|tara:strand:+ start:450 stop:1154 length:705 start_codon:yes stop_codon:yes gene_type:complete
MKDTIICILHQPHSKVRRVGNQIKKLGLNYRIIRPCSGEKLPENLKNYRGAIVFGGPMSVYEKNKYKFLNVELDWIKRVIDLNIPLFGICLGAQLIAKSIGGDVFPHYKKIHEVGYYPIFPENEYKNFFEKKEIFYAYQWHKDTFSIPNDATLIASGTKFKNQAFMYKKKTLAIQFHPELTVNVMKKWSQLAINRNIKGVQKIKELETVALNHEKSVRNWLANQLKNLFIKNSL